KEWDWITLPLQSDTPLADAVTVFTDAGKKSKKAAATWKQGATWCHHLIEGQENDSLQTLELAAVAWAVSRFLGPLNVITDSLYVAGLLQRIEDSTIKEVQNKRLYELLL
ncbi:POK19 protein, partial [Thryothorus ludovicianus]|nr:POK19 protein [Thryothorus ludovicianus]